MSVGKEYLHQLHEALAGFEGSIKQREHPGWFRSTVPLQQEVDHARQRVVDTVVKIVTEERLQAGR